MKFLVVGRTSTGKDTLANILEKEYGWKFVNSYTTRAKRYEDENTHIFVSKKFFNSIEPDKIIASTVIDNNIYFATKRQLNEADAYIVDPKGLYDVLLSSPDEQFNIVHIIPDTYSNQSKAFVKRENILSDDTDKEKKFKQRTQSENEQFSEFEKQVADSSLLKRDNVNTVIQYINTYNEDDIRYFARCLDEKYK